MHRCEIRCAFDAPRDFPDQDAPIHCPPTLLLSPLVLASPDEEDDVPDALDGALRVAAAVLGGGATTEPASRVAAGVVYCTGEGTVHT